MTDLRDLPQLGVILTTCHGCGEMVVWARTVAGRNGPGGKLMPLDPREDPAGNVAVTNPRRGRLLARVLTKGESADRPVEYLANTHFATCAARTRPEIPVSAVEAPVVRRRRRRQGIRR